MRVARMLLATGVALLLLSAPAHARSGGWWSTIDLNGSFVGAGEKLKTKATVMFQSVAPAKAASTSGGYYAYVLENFHFGVVRRAMGKPFDPDWWQLGDARAIRAGTVEFEGSKSNIVETTVDLEVPSVPPGRYALMLCDDGCANPLADVIPTRVTVAATAAEAKSIRLVARLQASVAKQRHRFGVKVRNLRRQIATAHELQALEGSVSESRGISQAADRKLQKDLDSMSRRLSGDWYDGLIWLGAGFVLGALLILLFVRHRRSQDEDVGFPATVPSTIEFVEESPRDELTPVG